MTEKTPEEKLDYIYQKIKAEEKRRTMKLISKWGTRLSIVLFLLYFYFFGFKIFVSKITEGLENKLKLDTNTIIEKKDTLINSAKENLQKLYKQKKEEINY